MQNSNQRGSRQSAYWHWQWNLTRPKKPTKIGMEIKLKGEPKFLTTIFGLDNVVDREANNLDQ
jgi:hypothetical protein